MYIFNQPQKNYHSFHVRVRHQEDIWFLWNKTIFWKLLLIVTMLFHILKPSLGDDLYATRT